MEKRAYIDEEWTPLEDNTKKAEHKKPTIEELDESVVKRMSDEVKRKLTKDN